MVVDIKSLWYQLLLDTLKMMNVMALFLKEYSFFKASSGPHKNAILICYSWQRMRAGSRTHEMSKKGQYSDYNECK